MSQSYPKNQTMTMLMFSICWQEDIVVAVAAHSKSIDDIRFIRFTEMCRSKEEVTDDYGHIIPPGVNFLSRHFLERDSTSRNATFATFANLKKENFLLG